MPVTTRAAARALAGDALPPAGEGDPAAQGAGEQVLRLLVEMATPRKLKRPASDHAGAAGSSSSSAPPAVPPSIKLSPATLLSLFRASAGMAEHVVRHAARTRLTLTSGATAATARFAAHANDLTLALQGAIPILTGLGTAALARVRRLELHDLTPTRAQLAALAQQLPSLEEVGLVRCALGQAQQQAGQRQPGAAAQIAAEEAPLPPSLLRLDVRSCRMSGEGGRGEGAAFAVALSLLRASDQLLHLDTTTPAHLVMEHLSALPGLTSIAVGDATDLGDLRPLLQHPSLTHVTLPGPLGLWSAAAVHPAILPRHQLQQLTLVGGDTDDLANLPLRSIDTVVLERWVRAEPRSSSSWEGLVARAREAGAALLCKPDEEGRFTIDGQLQQGLAHAEEEYNVDDCCAECGEDFGFKEVCRACGADVGDRWGFLRDSALRDCLALCDEAVEFVAQHLPKEGGPWHLVLKDCPLREPVRHGTRTLAGMLSKRLRNSKVASWEIIDEDE